MNDQNLIPNSERTREELQEMGRKGGIKSGESRRRKRELQQLAKIFFADIDMSSLCKFLGGGVGHDQ